MNKKIFFALLILGMMGPLACQNGGMNLSGPLLPAALPPATPQNPNASPTAAVPTPTDTPTPGTPIPTPIGTFCVQNMYCVQGTQWDPSVCACVPVLTPIATIVPTVSFTPWPTFCVQNMLCVSGTHWDSTTCGCVPNSSPSPTPTPLPGSVCGFTRLTPTDSVALGVYANAVIHNQTEWVQFLSQPGTNPYNSPTPPSVPTPGAPPVNFSQQMLVVIAGGCPCDSLTTQTITDVCVGPTQVTVYVTADTCFSCMICQWVPSYGCVVQEVAVPQSSLPVSWVITQTFH